MSYTRQALERQDDWTYWMGWQKQGNSRKSGEIRPLWVWRMHQWSDQEQDHSRSTSLTLPPWYSLCLSWHQLQELLHTQSQISFEKTLNCKRLAVHCPALSCSFISSSPRCHRKSQLSKALWSFYSFLSYITRLRNNQLQEIWTNWCDVIVRPLLPCTHLSLCDSPLI